MRRYVDTGSGRVVEQIVRPTGLLDPEVEVAFVTLFLARALEPVIVNKLKHKGDWNNDQYDAKKLTEYSKDSKEKTKRIYTESLKGCPGVSLAYKLQYN